MRLNSILYLMYTVLLLVTLPPRAESQERSEKLREGFLLSGGILKRQFRDLVKQPRESTVRFLNDRQPVALGVVVAEDGWVLTKASEIKEANRLQLADGTTYGFKYVGYHADHDLALVKIDANDLTPIVWESTEPVVGQWMVTVGVEREPVGLGVMSVPRRKIDSDGMHGVLGIELERVEEPVVKRVFANSGAEAAGLESGDMILKVNEEVIQTGRELIGTLRKHRPGETLMITFLRGDESQRVPVTLTHPFGDFLSRIALQNQMGGDLSFRRDNFAAVYQHDTVIEPRDCGGPVVNLDGKAFGINIARAGRTKTFVLPADIILEVLADLKSGKLRPPAIPSLTKRPQAPALPEVLETSGRDEK